VSFESIAGKVTRRKRLLRVDETFSLLGTRRENLRSFNLVVKIEKNFKFIIPEGERRWDILAVLLKQKVDGAKI
jgi:hypothetical protein